MHGTLRSENSGASHPPSKKTHTTIASYLLAAMRVSSSLSAWRNRAQISLSLLAIFLLSSTRGELEPLAVSVQPGAIWGVCFWIALKEGYFEELGLNVSYTVWASGAPQVNAAAENKTWDVGAAGCVPNVIGGLKEIDLIALSDDESEVSAMVANANGLSQWPPKSFDGINVAVTPNSTVHYAALKCLRDQYPDAPGYDFIFEQQDAVIQSLKGNEPLADYGTLWPPNLYSFLYSTEGAGIVCSGESANAKVLGGIMARREFGNEKPDSVARFLAAWIRGIGFIKNPKNREQSEKYFFDFTQDSVDIAGYVPAAGDIANEFALRPMFELEEQLAIFDRSKGKSQVDTWYEAVSKFMVENGAISTDPPVESYITDKYLKMVAENETLREFVIKDSVSYAKPEEEQSESAEASSALPQSVVFSALAALPCLAALLA